MRKFNLTDGGLKVGNADSVETWANNLIIVMGALIGLAGVLGVITGGIILMTAFGNEEKIQSGKTIILYSVLGVVFALLAYVLVSFIQTMIYSLDNSTQP